MCPIAARGCRAGSVPCPGADYVAVICLGAAMPLLRAVPVMLTRRARRLEETRPGEDGAPGPVARADRAGCRARAGQCADRRGPADHRGHRAQVAAPVRRPRARRLADLPRPGRPRRIGELDRAAVVALACQLPAATGVPLGRWTGPELAAELAVRGLASPMSASSVLRILAEHPVKPWQYQSWIYPRDPGLRGPGQGHRGPVPGLLFGRAAWSR